MVINGGVHFYDFFFVIGWPNLVHLSFYLSIFHHKTLEMIL